MENYRWDLTRLMRERQIGAWLAMSAAHASWLPRSTQGIPRVRMGGARLALALLVVPTRCRLYLTVEKRPAEQGRISHVEAREGSASALPASLVDQLR